MGEIFCNLARMSCCEVQVSLHEQLLPAVSQNP